MNVGGERRKDVEEAHLSSVLLLSSFLLVLSCFSERFRRVRRVINIRLKGIY